ncbi:MAG: ComEC family competence protein [Alphaproteobacteria bacterium]|nr:ComEC family competence protein [Alphaproteobacteria bacterium]
MDWARAFAGALAAQRERWPLWLPVALGVGVGAYFAPTSEPPPWLGAVLLAASVAVGAFGWPRESLRPLFVAGAAAALGFALAQVHAGLVDAPVVPNRERPAWVTGTVVYAEPWKSGVRLLLDRLTIERLTPEATPARVRVVAQGWRMEPPAPGTRIGILTVLAPPAGPVAPGAFDYRRQAFFERLGGTGYALGAGTILAPPDHEASLARRLAALRSDLSNRIRAALPGPTGAVAAALLTGERAAIPETVNQAMRDSGLFHLLSISGLHLSLVAGFVFAIVRAGLALIEPVMLRFPIKKWAALVAIAATALYLGLSGASVPTQRAFLMTTIALVAVVLDRSPFSMRLVAVAAAAVLIGAPESLLGASFQLSFAAVVALIAVYEVAGERGWFARARGGWRRWIVVWSAGLALSSLVAGAATGAIAAYHFNRITLWGVASNMFAVPVTGVWVMPWGMAALLLVPFGLERLALVPMGWGIDAILTLADEVASWPLAAFTVPVAPFVSLLAVTLGGLWLCLWRGRVRWLGLVGFAAAGLAWAAAEPPDALVDAEARTAALRAPDGRYALAPGRGARQATETWLRQVGQSTWAPWAEPGAPTAWMTCDALGCLARLEHGTIAVVRDPLALAEDCQAADVLILLGVEGHARCSGPTVIDGRFAARAGATAIWLEADGPRLVTVAETRGERLWTAPAPY